MRSLIPINYKRHTLRKVSFSIFILFFVFIAYNNVLADEYTSSSYKVLDPVIAPSGFATSTNFQLLGTISEVANGTSVSASYNVGGGFLRFPFAQILEASTTAADSAVTVNWTPAIGYGGWTISSYSVGQATVSGGPYTFTNVGNVTSSQRTSLTNDTPYYFVVVANDIFGNAVATSTEVTGTPLPAQFTFVLNANAVYFGTLNSSVTIYASSTNPNGSLVEVDSNVIEIKTGAPNGYTLTVQGQTLTSLQNSSKIITPLISNTAPATGSSQFGLRATANGGTGLVVSPYNGSGFAFAATATTTSQVAGAVTGSSATTTYGVRYMTNINPLTSTGDYATDLIYVATANF